MNDIFVVGKKTGNYADSLVALGAADLLKEIASAKGTTAKVMIRDRGDRFEIHTDPAVDAEALRLWLPNPGYPFIKTKPNVNVPLGYPCIDYVHEREVEARARTRQARLTRSGTGRRRVILAQASEEIPEAPRPDLSVLKSYNSLRMTSNSYNELFLSITKHREELRNRVGYHLGLSDTKIPIDTARESIFEASSLAFFQPTAGKGANLTKPKGTGRSALPDNLVDWFDEWMKYRAMHLGMLAYFTGPGGKDNKVLVLAPADIGLDEIIKLRQALLGNNQIWGSTRSDILAVLFITEELIRHSKEFDSSGGSLSFLGNMPPQLVGGLYSGYFKSVGSAKAIMNVSFLGLPGWFPIESTQDAEDWLSIINEHRECIKAMREDRSEDISLLLSYRAFLSSGDLSNCLEFFSSFAAWLMQRKARQEYARDFTTVNLKRMCTMFHLEEIIDNAGFINIATAIRKATINQQYQKSITGANPFEIRYSLAQDWKRRANYPEQFIVALSDFVQSYNAENARHAEQKVGSKRADITIEDLKQVVALIDKNGSELVGMLLLAFGYARDPKDRNAVQEAVVEAASAPVTAETSSSKKGEYDEN